MSGSAMSRAAAADGGRAVADRFRPSARRRTRIALGSGITALAIVANVFVYASLDRRVEVLQVVADVRAGEVVEAAHIRIVEVAADPTVPTVAAGQLGSVIGQHARVHLASGTLLAPVLIQTAPLVTSGMAVVAVELRSTLVPVGVRERSRLEVVVVDDDEASRIPARAVTRPEPVDGVSGLLSLSVEVSPPDAALVASASAIRLVLLDPGADPVYREGS